MNDDRDFGQDETRGDDVSRRTFGALSLAAGAAVAAPAAFAAAPLEVKETDVQIKTADGMCDAVLVHPVSGTYPGVIIWVDALGLRPAFRDMAKRQAAEGYTVLVPNPYYRLTKAPGLPPGFSFEKPEDRAQLGKLMGSLTPASVTTDAGAFIAFLDSQPAMKKGAKIGTHGYCMGGALTMRTAAAYPDRIAAAGSFHGGGLATDKPESPHLLIPKMKAQYHVAIAADDDKAQPDAKDKLKAAFEAAKLKADIEVYEGALHGWCMADMPPRAGVPLYNKAQAERAWAKLSALFKTALA
ncbi:MAG: dienelactone hydrolase family protein [Rhodospirillaceae bacterium]|nr:dienelactone hydrolase family protein [Rhodospirillaceae bacterium]